MNDILISYAKPDKKKAQQIAEALTQKNLSVFWDRDKITDNHFRKTILESIKTSKCTLALLSKDSLSRRWVLDEAFQAARQKKLIPVAIEDIDSPNSIGGYQTVSLTHWKTGFPQQEFETVFSMIQNMLENDDQDIIELDEEDPTHEDKQTDLPLQKKLIKTQKRRILPSVRPGLEKWIGIVSLICISIIIGGALFLIYPERIQTLTLDQFSFLFSGILITTLIIVAFSRAFTYIKSTIHPIWIVFIICFPLWGISAIAGLTYLTGDSINIVTMKIVNYTRNQIHSGYNKIHQAIDSIRNEKKVNSQGDNNSEESKKVISIKIPNDQQIKK